MCPHLSRLVDLHSSKITPESENSYPAFGRIVRACSISADVRSRYVGGTWICPWLNVPKVNGWVVAFGMHDLSISTCIAEVLLMFERFPQRSDLISQVLCEAVDLLFPLSLRLQCFADARLFCFLQIKSTASLDEMLPNILR